MTATRRNSADNLLLLCGLHHPDSDKRAQQDLLTLDQVQALKAEHERRVFEATSSVGRKRTVLLRMQGHIRGATVDLGLEAATEAVLRSSNRFPVIPGTFSGSRGDARPSQQAAWRPRPLMRTRVRSQGGHTGWNPVWGRQRLRCRSSEVLHPVRLFVGLASVSVVSGR
jgi:hypothetical protein